MTDYGVTPAGFVLKPQSAIVGEMASDCLGTIASDLDLDPEEPFAQALAIIAKQLSKVWGLGQAAFNSTNRGAAEDTQLDNIGSLIGNTREGAFPSSVFCTAQFTSPGTRAPGACVAFLPSSSGVQFKNENAIVVPSTNPDTTTVSPAHPFSAEGLFFVATVDGPNPANALIAANALASIPFGSLTGIVPSSGWLSVVDTSAPTIGALIEQDTQYRIRQVTELSAPGACTLDANVADIAEALANAPHPVTGVTITPYENTGFAIDSNGLPGKSYELVIFDGLSPNTAQNDPIIAATIWKGKPAGLQPFGTTLIYTKDSQGNRQPVAFSRPTQVPVYFAITVAYDSGAAPDAVVAAVAQAVFDVSQGKTFQTRNGAVTPADDEPAVLTPGGDVIVSAFQTIAGLQSGVKRVQKVAVGLAPNPTTTADITFPATQIAVVTGVAVITVPFLP